MDLHKIIEDLHAERSRLDAVIRSLEILLEESGGSLTASAARKRRGRKSMSQEERRKVSQRMREYWAKRRNQ